jgi:hypothetical protein
MDPEYDRRPTGSIETTPTLDRSFWEERWSQVLREHPATWLGFAVALQFLPVLVLGRTAGSWSIGSANDAC